MHTQRFHAVPVLVAEIKTARYSTNPVIINSYIKEAIRVLEDESDIEDSPTMVEALALFKSVDLQEDQPDDIKNDLQFGDLTVSCYDLWRTPAEARSAARVDIARLRYTQRCNKHRGLFTGILRKLADSATTPMDVALNILSFETHVRRQSVTH